MSTMAPALPVYAAHDDVKGARGGSSYALTFSFLIIYPKENEMTLRQYDHDHCVKHGLLRSRYHPYSTGPHIPLRLVPPGQYLAHAL